MRVIGRHPAQRGTRCCCDENLQCGAKMRALASHPAQRGTRCRVLMTACSAARRCEHSQDIQHSAAQGAVVVQKICGEESKKDARTCKTSSTARHKVPWLRRKFAISAMMRALARHPAQLGRQCRGCHENLRCSAKMRALARYRDSVAHCAVASTPRRMCQNNSGPKCLINCEFCEN